MLSQAISPTTEIACDTHIHTFTHNTIYSYIMTTTITHELLIRQRNFFLSAIALTLLPNILIDICKYCCYGFNVDVNSTGIEVVFVIIGIIATLSILVYFHYLYYILYH